MNKILVVLPNWYGEVIFATPFLSVLRRALPHSKIFVMGWPQAEVVLRYSALIDGCLVYDEKGREKSLAAKWRLLCRLRAERFDAAFLLRRSRSRGWLLALAGIPRRIGWGASKSGGLNEVFSAPAWGEAPRYVPGMDVWVSHKAATYMPLLDAVAPGLSGQRAPYVFELTQQECDAARQLLDKHGLTPGGPPVVFLHPGANWRFKRWPAECFAALARRLHARAFRCVLSGGPDDAELCRTIADAAGVPLVSLQGKTTLRELAACLTHTDLIVSNDTGVMHSAVAVGCPTVALFGPTSPALTGPLGDASKVRVLHHPDCCPQIPCFEPEVARAPGMRSITVDEVYNAAVELLRSWDRGIVL